MSIITQMGVPGVPGSPPMAQGVPSAPAAPHPGAMPMGSPMASPTNASGQQAVGHVGVQIAMKVLEHALPAFGSETKEGRAIIRTLNSLSKDFGKQDDSDLVPAEIMQMVRQMPQMGGGSPVQRALIAQMRQGNAGGPPQAPPGAAAPPAAPPPGVQQP